MGAKAAAGLCQELQQETKACSSSSSSSSSSGSGSGGSSRGSRGSSGSSGTAASWAFCCSGVSSGSGLFSGIAPGLVRSGFGALGSHVCGPRGKFPRRHLYLFVHLDHRLCPIELCRRRGRCRCHQSVPLDVDEGDASCPTFVFVFSGEGFETEKRIILRLRILRTGK